MHFQIPLLAVWAHLSATVFAQAYRYHLDTISTCTSWYDNAGDYTCLEIRTTLGISAENFTRWNPSISLACDGWEQYTSYCAWVSTEFPIPSTTSTTSSSTTATSTSKPTPTSWTPVGCWPIGATDFPTLDYTSPSALSSDATPSKCGAACIAVPDASYVYAGIASGTKCLCGDFIRNDMSDEIELKCNIPCAGNASLSCGGTDYVNIYKAVYATATFTTTSGSAAATKV